MSVPRVDEVLPGVRRVRLPIRWADVKSVNVWTIDDGDGGCVLVDCGMDGPGAWDGLDAGLRAAGYAPDRVSLLVITHCHGDHYGLAEPLVEAAGCELWMHPAYEHFTGERADVRGLAARRVERARAAGAPESVQETSARELEEVIDTAGVVPPDRELVDGVEIETAAGTWRVVETPGHAPSHVCLFEPERRVLISGDHVLPVWAPFYDHGYTPDPIAEYARGLDAIEPLAPEIVLPGHGRACPDGEEVVRAMRAGVESDLDAVRAALRGRPRTTWQVIEAAFPAPNDFLGMWAIPTTLVQLDHLALRGEIVAEEGADGVVLWRQAPAQTERQLCTSG